jgi:uncharacterized membrane protein YfcA
VSATFAGATLQSATGFGYALVAGPATFAVAEPAEALTILIALSTVLNVLVIAGEKRASSIQRQMLLPVLAWAIPGVAAGVAILLAISKPTLQVVVGICVVIAVALAPRGSLPMRRDPTLGAKAAAGFTAGTLTTTTATSGPPLVLLLQRAGSRPEEFRDTMAALLLGLNILGALALVLGGAKVELPVAGVVAILIAVIVAGRALGRLIFNRLDADSFRTVGSFLIVASGLASVAAGLAG